MEKRLIEEDLVRRIQGTVKWFAPSRGYGFVQHRDSDDDILLHENVLSSFGRSSVSEDSIIDAFVRQTARGLQVTEIISIDASLGSAGGLAEPTTLFDVSEYQPARVKWYDKIKSFGFVNLYGDDTDYFIHERQLRDAGLNSLVSGEALSVVASKGEKGATISAARSWVRTSLDCSRQT